MTSTSESVSAEDLVEVDQVGTTSIRIQEIDQHVTAMIQELAVWLQQVEAQEDLVTTVQVDRTIVV
jgi:hypothetical protein